MKDLQEGSRNFVNARTNNRQALAYIKVILTSVAAFILLEALIFRTGFYARFLEPSSSTGLFENVFRDECNRKPFGPDEILVVGDSKIGEGFSARIANSACPKGGYYFANVAVAGTTPRCWYYLLRDLDPARKRYRAIVLSVTRYDDVDDYEDLADRLGDLHYVIARLRYEDIFSFGFSFSSSRNRLDAIRGILFKGLVFQSDMIAFMEHTRRRLRDVALSRQYGWEWRNNYSGRSEDLSGLTVDWTQKIVRFPAALPELERGRIQQALFGPVPPQTGALARYRRQWFGRIIALYRSSNTKLIFLAYPRGPVMPPAELVRPLSCSICDLGKSPGVILLPETLFAALEKLDYFFDGLHLNSRGRAQFSIILAQEMRRTLGPSRN